MKVELTIDRTKELRKGAVPALEKELSKRLQNQFDECSLVKRINAGDRKGACEAIRWWIKDGGRDCRLTKGQKNGCYGQVERRDQESALTCWELGQ